MTQCAWCGMFSEGDDVCSYCQKPFKAPAPRLLPVAKPVSPDRRASAFAVGAVAIVILFGIMAFAGGGSSKPVELSTTQMGSPAATSARAIPVSVASGQNLAENQPAALSEATAPSPAAAETANEDSTADSSTQGLPLSTVPNLVGDVQLDGAQFTGLGDNGDRQNALGSVTITNDGDFAITDFNLTLEVDGVDYRLSPFQGTPDNPMPVLARRIEPGQQIEVPVMTTTPYTADPLISQKRLLIRAYVDGPPRIVSDAMDLN